jgi:alpha-L-fucosidase
VGLYYSFGDFRVPAYWDDPAANPEGWAAFRDYVHGQVRELLTDYGPIDVFWFDGAWPHTASEWRSAELLARMRALQPHLLINNRLDSQPVFSPSDGAVEAAGESAALGDFGTPEHRIVAQADRLWESCNTSTHRLWGYAVGEHWRSAEHLLEMLVECAARGGNLLLNVGPDGDGRMPESFLARAHAIGRWLALHREALVNLDLGERLLPDITEFVTRGYQTRSGRNLYLILRFWDGRPTLRLAALATPVRRATVLSTGQALAVRNTPEAVYVDGVPAAPPCELFPVIKLECDGRPEPKEWDRPRLWNGDPRRFIEWAATRGRTPWVGR